MNRVAVAFSTADRTELTKRSIEPLLQPRKFDLHWVDGSKTEEGRDFLYDYSDNPMNRWVSHRDIRGGSGPAIVYALTILLQYADGMKRAYDYIGLVENDVLLSEDWFDDTMALFERGKQDGLEVGAVSARCYEDRILIQRDGYAICHNLGAGMIIFSRKAAELVLQNYRTVFTTENRLLFAQLSGIDIAAYWAFRGSQHWLCADWNFDRVLAANGLASLALTPNRVTMLDQDIGPLGLKYANGAQPVESSECREFGFYCDNLRRIREGNLIAGIHHPFYHDGNSFYIMAHQVPQLGGKYEGDWRIRDNLGFGPFVWRAGKPKQDLTPPAQVEPLRRVYTPATLDLLFPTLTILISGPCDFLVSGGKEGGTIRVEDEQSGYSVEPFLKPETGQDDVLQLSVPASAGYRNVKLMALTPGVCFFGIKTREPQPWLPQVRFDYSTLPPA